MGRHWRLVDRSRRRDLAGNPRSVTARPVACRAKRPDQFAVAELYRRPDGYTTRCPRPVARESGACAYRSWGARGRGSGRGAAGRRLQTRRWNLDLSGIRAHLAQLPGVERQRGAVAISHHARSGRQRRWLSPGTTLPALGSPAATVDGRLFDASEADARLVLDRRHWLRAEPRNRALRVRTPRYGQRRPALGYWLDGRGSGDSNWHRADPS